jgi:hypothetical protein
MERRILFRGTRLIHTDEWVVGNLIELGEGYAIRTTGEWGKEESVWEGSIDEYVGLLDKNKERLFERDYVKFRMNYCTYVGQLLYDNDTFMFAIRYDKGWPEKSHMKILLPLHVFAGKDLEKVGDPHTHGESIMMCNDELEYENEKIKEHYKDNVYQRELDFRKTDEWRKKFR